MKAAPNKWWCSDVPFDPCGVTIPDLGRVWEVFLEEVTYMMKPRTAITSLGQKGGDHPSCS